jgi:multidrug efflux pump
VQFVIGTTDPFDQLNDVQQALMGKAMATGMFAFLDTDLKIDKPQATVEIDRDKAALLGLTMRDIGSALGSMLGGGYINYFDISGRSYKVIPQVLQHDRLNAPRLLDYYITTASGATVPVSSVASITSRVVPESLNHFQQLNAATISAVPASGVTLGEALETLKGLAADILPAGYSIDYAGQSRQYMQETRAFLVTFFFALIIIFLSLSALFESFRDPVIILVSVPMSICGAMIFISLGIGNSSLNIYTEVGLVTLIGLISKHGILIVQFANDLQSEGKAKRESIEAAAAIRLRPILMTTAAMVLGVVPLVMASGAGAEGRFNMGLVIMTGISVGTLFTLFVVPAMYLFLATDRTKQQKAA